MKKEIPKFDIKIELDESPTDYSFTPFYVKSGSSKGKAVK